MSKLLTVFGSTGQQGGSLIEYVLNHPKLSQLYHLRGITREPSKPSAVALKEKGVEVIQADLNDPLSLVAAVADSSVVFGVTNFWDTMSAETEIAQGKAIADASVAAGVELLIWSSLPNVTKMSGGTLTTVHHFDSKAKVEEYIRGLPVMSVFFMAGYYMQNYVAYTPPKVRDDGSIVLALVGEPTDLIPAIDITDTGKFLSPILFDPHKYNGQSFTCATAFYTPLQLVEGWTRVTGKKVTYEQISDVNQGKSNLTEEMRKVLKESRGLISKYSYFGPTGKKDLDWTLAQMTDAPTSWEEFVRANEPWFPTA